MLKRIIFSLAFFAGALGAAYGQSSVFPQNSVLAGPTSGSGHAAPRLLVGADLPNPTASTKGGVESLVVTAHQWINTISTSGVPSSTQPACADISNAGTVCTQNTGTSGANVPLLNGANTWSAGQTLSAALTYGGVTLSNAVTGTGNMVLSAAPTLTTPTLGDATATTLNKISFPPPATSATINMSNNKVLTINNTLQFAGVDATTITFQGTDTYVGRATTDTLTNKSIDTGGNTFTFGASGTTTTTATCTGGGSVSAGSTINWIFRTFGKMVWAQASFTPTHTCVTSVSMPLPSGTGRMNQTLSGQQGNANLSLRGWIASGTTTAECTTSSGNPCTSGSAINLNGWYEIN